MGEHALRLGPGRPAPPTVKIAAYFSTAAPYSISPVAHLWINMLPRVLLVLVISFCQTIPVAEVLKQTLTHTCSKLAGPSALLEVGQHGDFMVKDLVLPAGNRNPAWGQYARRGGALGVSIMVRASDLLALRCTGFLMRSSACNFRMRMYMLLRAPALTLAMLGPAFGDPLQAYACVSDAAVKRAEVIIGRMLADCPSRVVDRLVEAGTCVAIIGKDQVTTDIPEHEFMKWSEGVRVYILMLILDGMCVLCIHVYICCFAHSRMPHLLHDMRCICAAHQLVAPRSRT